MRACCGHEGVFGGSRADFDLGDRVDTRFLDRLGVRFSRAASHRSALTVTVRGRCLCSTGVVLAIPLWPLFALITVALLVVTNFFGGIDTIELRLYGSRASAVSKKAA